MTLFCKDCKFYFVSYHGDHECHSPRNISQPDLVTGETHWKFSCERARSASQHCSKEAIWFSLKPPSRREALGKLIMQIISLLKDFLETHGHHD